MLRKNLFWCQDRNGCAAPEPGGLFYLKDPEEYLAKCVSLFVLAAKFCAKFGPASCAGRLHGRGPWPHPDLILFFLLFPLHLTLYCRCLDQGRRSVGTLTNSVLYSWLSQSREKLRFPASPCSEIRPAEFWRSFFGFCAHTALSPSEQPLQK